MTERRQKIGGTTAELDQLIGAARLLAVDTSKNELRVFDGFTQGGHRIPSLAEIDALYALPDRLESTGKSLTTGAVSINSAIEGGFYHTDADVTDQPEAAAASVLVIVSLDAADDSLAQHWTRIDGVVQYRRVRQAAIWGAWIKILDKNSIENDSDVTAYNAARLADELPAYYTDIVARLGYTPVDTAGDTITGNLAVDGFIDVGDDATTRTNLGLGTIAVEAVDAVPSTFRLADTTDPTKKAGFVLSSLAAAATRLITLQDRSMTLGMVLLHQQALNTNPTAVDFAIPTDVRRIVVVLDGISTNGTSIPVLRTMTASGVDTGGYEAHALALVNGAGVSGITRTTGFPISHSVASSTTLSGAATFTKARNALSGNIWDMFAPMRIENAIGFTIAGGNVDTEVPLNGLRLTTENGTDFFDTGYVVIYAEY